MTTNTLLNNYWIISVEGTYAPIWLYPYGINLVSIDITIDTWFPFKNNNVIIDAELRRRSVKVFIFQFLVDKVSFTMLNSDTVLHKIRYESLLHRGTLL